MVVWTKMQPTRQSCLICKSPVEAFVSFGRMPIANGFLTPNQFSVEPFFELAIGYCDQCKMVQLTELVDPEKMFHENYAFFSSTSSRMAACIWSYDLQIQAAIASVRAFFKKPPSVTVSVHNAGIVNRAYAGYITPGKIAPHITWYTKNL